MIVVTVAFVVRTDGTLEEAVSNRQVKWITVAEVLVHITKLVSVRSRRTRVPSDTEHVSQFSIVTIVPGLIYTSHSSLTELLPRVKSLEAETPPCHPSVNSILAWTLDVFYPFVQVHIRPQPPSRRPYHPKSEGRKGVIKPVCL